MRTSESKELWQLVDLSSGFEFEVHELAAIPTGISIFVALDSFKQCGG
jgi:hypothetical protein